MVYDLTNELQCVTAFHRAFAHPVGQRHAPMSIERRLTRLCWASSELRELELAQAQRPANYLDALNDYAYFQLGNLVEMGVNAFVVPTGNAPVMTHKEFANAQTRLLFELMTADTLDQQAALIRHALSLTVTYHNREQGVPFRDIFAIVHDANMRKLWPDGKPRYRKEDGKVLKPEGWIPPETRIEAYLTETRIEAYLTAMSSALRNAA